MPLKIEQLKNFKKLTALLAVIALLIIAATALKTCFALWLKNTRLKAELIQKTEEAAKSADISPLKKTGDAEVKKLEEKLSSIEDGFSAINTEEIFSSLNRFVEASGISLKSISPLEKTEAAIPGTQEKYLELPVNLKLECSYNQLLSFLDKIENTGRAMSVTNIKIQNNPQNIWEHNIELSLIVPMLTVSTDKSNNK